MDEPSLQQINKESATTRLALKRSPAQWDEAVRADVEGHRDMMQRIDAAIAQHAKWVLLGNLSKPQMMEAWGRRIALQQQIRHEIEQALRRTGNLPAHPDA